MNSLFEDVHWYNFISYDSGDSSLTYLLCHIIFMCCSSSEEMAEYLEIRDRCNDSREALSAIYHRCSYRAMQQSMLEHAQERKLKYSSSAYDPVLYKEEYRRWSARNISEEEMNIRRYGTTERTYTIEERLAEPILFEEKYDRYIHYKIHDKINGGYTVEVINAYDHSVTTYNYRDTYTIECTLPLKLKHIADHNALLIQQAQARA